MLFRSRTHALAFRSRLLRVNALLCFSAVLTTSTGCFGTFPLTRTLYRENQEISNVEFHQTLAFWAMVLTLVYPGAVLSDTIVMNTIEFWKPEPTSWEQSGAFVPTPADRYETAEIGPEPPAPVTAPIESVAEAPQFYDEPALSAPGAMLPGTPTVPLPLPPLAPVFEEPELRSERTLSLSDGPGFRP